MVDIPKTESNCFVSLYQVNDRFMFEGIEDDEADDYEYAEAQLIVTKVIKIPPQSGGNHTDHPIGECTYIDGATSSMYNSVFVKINKMTAG
jgi:hypothetical protein